MGRTTIRDIAAKADVSTATVDRALNDRPGVSIANRQRVLRAARELGYLPFEGMVPLPSRPVHLRFLIPVGRNSFMRDLAAALTDFAATLPVVASCEVTALDGIGPEALAAALDRLPLETHGAGIVAVDHPATREAIGRLCEAGVRVVTIASDVSDTPRSAYVGIDNYVAGRTAALLTGLMSRAMAGSVGLFLGSRAFSGHRAREAGFRTLLKERFPGLSTLDSVETGEESSRSRPAMAALLRSSSDLAGIYCVGAGRSGIVDALRGSDRATRPLVILHDLTDRTQGWLAEDLVDVVIDQNTPLVAEQAVIRLLGAIATGNPLLNVREIEPRIILRENVPAR